MICLFPYEKGVTDKSKWLFLRSESFFSGYEDDAEKNGRHGKS